MTRLRSAAARTLAASALLGSLPFAQELITVGPSAGPGIDFTNLQAAVDAATADATILVRAGEYQGFLVSQKSLHFVAETGASVRIVSGVTIFGLDAQQSVTLRGIDLWTDTDTVLSIGSGSGSVWIEDATIDVADQTLLDAIVVNGCASVVLAGVDVRGPYRTAALRVFGNAAPAAVHVFDSQLRGGNGDPSLVGFQDGAAAAEVHGASFFASGSTITGGDGSHLVDPWFGCAQGAGGSGLAMSAGTSVAQVGVLDTAVQGGSGAEGCGSLPMHGPDYSGSGDLLTLPGAHRTLAVNSPVREGETLSLSLGGAPGEFALLLLGAPAATLTGPAAWSAWNAPLLLSANASAFVLGAVPASGALELSFPVAELGVDALTVAAQSAFLDFGAGGVRIGPTASVALIDAAL